MLAVDAAIFVISHPDDEAMFFFPSLTALAKSCDVTVLSLSNGGADGLGRTRTAEMAAAAHLGGYTAVVVDDTKLRDGFSSKWHAADVARVVQPHVLRVSEKARSVAVVTFDGLGVSRHPNHVDTSIGVDWLFANALRREAAVAGTTISLYHLESLRWWSPRRFLALLDICTTLMLAAAAGQTGLVFVNLRLCAVWRAMAAHASQFVWYRRLFVVFSRYAYVNRLVAVDAIGGGGGGGGKVADGSTVDPHVTASTR
ncbi:putative deacetylase LmbE-like domain-containing protein [Pelagophyceae sp. CCMP2097]|nr:putative deacetylase LmbE-like domain-containing protein [Pelagophyceae sp. CCMP2097]